MKNYLKTVKRIIPAILLIILMISSASVPALANDDINVYVDNKIVTFDVKPQLIGGRTMVPLRAIFESLGATVNWDDETQTITAYNELYIVKAQINSNLLVVNNVNKQIDVPPMLVESRTLVPARFIAEAFGCDVQWNGDTKTVSITTKPINYNNIEQPTNNQNQPKQDIENNVSNSNSISFNQYSFEPTREIEVKCKNIIKGSEANSIIESENMFNHKPQSGQEWIILEMEVKYISSSAGSNDELNASDIIYDDTFFTSDKSSLGVADMATLGKKYEGHGVFDVKMYPGSSAKKVVIGLLIDKYNGEILLRIPTNAGNGAEWISCGQASSSKTYKEDDVYVNNNTKSSSKYYNGTNLLSYTYVTGEPIKRTLTLDSGGTCYIYEYGKDSDPEDYWGELVSDGWTLITTNDETTSETFESGFYKGKEGVIVNVLFDLNEVWVVPMLLD